MQVPNGPAGLIFIRHGHESEPEPPVADLVGHEPDLGHLPISLKDLLKVLFRCVGLKIANIDDHGLPLLSNRTQPRHSQGPDFTSPCTAPPSPYLIGQIVP
jgi:hypothetical protein